ncbi:isochorismate synthase [Aquabacterium sp.]|uniref:isochorismate synthase n=1 Tax=Aquabacterium sp. TaxID=1872578 RepID=UPI002487EBD9|nr:isochorismate synthase [Aquabacterium sp.]MDI1261533.1 isochorismate synthase [Aquabacterium sp.]
MTQLPDADSGHSFPPQARYCGNVEKALRQIEAGHLDKVVLSRSRKLLAQVDVPRLVQRLMPRNLMGYTYAINLEDSDLPSHARTLVGASPELLLRKRDRHVVSHPLAGSIPRSADALEDQRRAARLLESAKDLREHAYVVDAVAHTLAPYCRTLIVPPAPTLVSTPTMWHLGTRIVGELKDEDASALELALALHPTPAVCGHPNAAAKNFIRQHEGFDRAYFAGLVGWTDLRGDGEWAVTIRCAEVTPQHATLYAGAGVVSGSDPQREWAETEAKMATMWGAMASTLVKEAA